MTLAVTVKQALIDVGERTGWTFAQQFFVVLALGGATALNSGHHWLDALLAALWAAMVTVVTASAAIIAKYQPTSPTMLLLDRAGRTFISSLSGLLIASQFTSFGQVGALQAVGVALSTSFIAAVKSLIGSSNVNTVADSAYVPRHALGSTFTEPITEAPPVASEKTVAPDGLVQYHFADDPV